MSEVWEAFYTECHFTKCRWEEVKIIGWAAWGEALVEFKDGKRKTTAYLKRNGKEWGQS